MGKPAPRCLTEDDVRMVRAVASVHGWNAGEIAKQLGPGVVTRQAIGKILTRKTYGDVPAETYTKAARRAGKFKEWLFNLRTARGLQGAVVVPVSARERANWELVQTELEAEQPDKDAAELAAMLESRIQISVTYGQKWWTRRLVEAEQQDWTEEQITAEFEKHLRCRARWRAEIVARFYEKPPRVGKAREKRLARLRAVRAKRAKEYAAWVNAANAANLVFREEFRAKYVEEYGMEPTIYEYPEFEYPGRPYR